MDGLALGGDGDKIVVQLLQAFFLAAAGQADAVAHRLFLQRGMVLQKHRHAVHRVDGGVHVLRFAGKLQRRAAADRRDMESLLQQADILVPIAENGGGQLDAVQFDPFFQQADNLQI